MSLPSNPGFIPPPEIYPTNRHILKYLIYLYEGTYSHIKSANICEQPKWMSIGKWLNEFCWYIHTVESERITKY